MIRPKTPGVVQEPPLPVSVELAAGAEPPPDLAERIRAAIIATNVIVATEIALVPHRSLAAQRIQEQAGRFRRGPYSHSPPDFSGG